MMKMTNKPSVNFLRRYKLKWISMPIKLSCLTVLFVHRIDLYVEHVPLLTNWDVLQDSFTAERHWMRTISPLVVNLL